MPLLTLQTQAKTNLYRRVPSRYEPFIPALADLIKLRY